LTTVVWTFAAVADLEEIRRYIGAFNPHAAKNTAGRLIAAGNGLANFPDRGRPVSDTELRELTVVPLTLSATGSMATAY